MLPGPLNVKVGALTVSAIVVCAVVAPDVPVIVTVAVPIAAVPLAAIVISPLELIGFGVKKAVTPLGKPLAESVTFPVKPF
jgi:hypothetical protein